MIPNNLLTPNVAMASALWLKTRNVNIVFTYLRDGYQEMTALVYPPYNFGSFDNVARQALTQLLNQNTRTPSRF